MLLAKISLISVMIFSIVACSGSGSSSNATIQTVPAPPPSPITLTGFVQDGPVVGGTIYIFPADDIATVISTANSSGDRGASLLAANPIVTISRSEDDGASYTAQIDGALAGTGIFVIFDNQGSIDETFGDLPFNLESTAILSDAGTSQQVNLSSHASLISILVRDNLTGPITSGDIDLAATNIISALGADEFGNPLADVNIISLSDEEAVEAASTFIGSLVRSGASFASLSNDQVLLALAADSADGVLDGSVPTSFSDANAVSNAAVLNPVFAAGRVNDSFIGGSCTVVADILGKACEFNVLDDFFEGKAVCLDTDDEEEFEECLADVELDKTENVETCSEVLEAHLDICDDFDDEVHDPDFGELFTANFVDPLNIGTSIEANPWFPLVVGNKWVYEGLVTADEDEEEEEEEDTLETITVTITNKTKLINGISCIVVIDVAEVDGEVIEITEDWYAQDVEGNVWYCGEISQNFESIEGDNPDTPELVDIEGSWKDGRDGAQAGILLPMDPEVGDIFRQEVEFGEAEDVMQIESINGTESSVGGSCEGTCLVTKEFSPLDVDAEENKYYIPGLGLILEIDLENGDRIELKSFTGSS